MEFKHEFWLGRELDENGEVDVDNRFGWSVIVLSPDAVEEGEIDSATAEAFVADREPHTGEVDSDVSSGRQYVYKLSRNDAIQLIGDEEVAAYDLREFDEIIGLGPAEGS